MMIYDDKRKAANSQIWEAESINDFYGSVLK